VIPVLEGREGGADPVDVLEPVGVPHHLRSPRIGSRSSRTSSKARREPTGNLPPRTSMPVDEMFSVRVSSRRTVRTHSRVAPSPAR
jgi:hypothetical protein